MPDVYNTIIRFQTGDLMQSVTLFMNYFSALEDIVAELDTIFNNLLEIRQQKVFVARRVDRALLRAYAAVGLALQILIKDLSSSRKVENAHFGEHASTISRNFALSCADDFNTILRGLYARIRALKVRIKELDEIRCLLTQLNITKRLEHEDAVLDIKKHDDNLIIITNRKIIIHSNRINALQLVPIGDLETISYKRSFRFRGCEIRTKTGDIIRIPVDADVAFELKKILDKLAGRCDLVPGNYISSLKSKRSKLRPSIMEVKLSILRKMVPLV